jgi:hypothetical protein
VITLRGADVPNRHEPFNSVELFDGSRNLYVRLYNDKLFFRVATASDWSFNKPGRWRNN